MDILIFWLSFKNVWQAKTRIILTFQGARSFLLSVSGSDALSLINTVVSPCVRHSLLPLRNPAEALRYE